MNTDRTAGVLALLALVAAGWWSIRLARADAEFRTGTQEGVARAVELAPWNTAFLSLQALQIGYAGGDSGALLEKIARITPDASVPRIGLGLEAEARGDMAGAERWLLDAARVDHQYEPRWTLANFYFRQGKTDEFWKWVRAALEVSYGNRDAAFELCWRVAPDAGVILARAIPDRHAAVAAFLDYLERADRGDRGPVAVRLSLARDAGDLPGLETEMDRLLMAGRREEALEIWRNLGFPAPTGVVYNPDFALAHVGHGFDWKFGDSSGIGYTVLDMPAGLRISFSGMQPEEYVLLQQHLDVRKGKRYLMRWEASGISSGISWRAGGVSAPVQAGQLAFVAMRDGDAIELAYARPVGEARAEGSMELRHISVEEVP
jgi:hypothetical protein